MDRVVFFRAGRRSFPTSGFPFSLNLNGSCAIVKTYIFWMKLMSTTSTPNEERWRSPVYHFQKYVENLENYRPGGFHPVRLGDEFSHSRYRVVHKLGMGSFATIWLARDEVTRGYVALKMFSAAKSKTTIELEALNTLQGYAESHHPGRPYVLRLLDQFQVEGPNGKHECLVSEVLGCNLHYAKMASEHNFLPLPVA